ncbi:DinB family protein [Bacillus cereus group sp. MYBK79-1]|uniref:DinB family protein n=1 Tax=unclassified Bacillus cereus group TaxID=2750818 RepID=UPI003F78DC97
MELVYKITYHRMQDHYLSKLLQTISLVSEEDLWKQGDSVNSIGGIVLHICEHIQRNASRYKNPNIVFEKGIEEYFPVKLQRTEVLLQYVVEVFDEWGTAYIQAWEEKRHIDLHSLLHLVEHTSYHLGQVVDRTKSIMGQQFNFCQNGINEKNLRTRVETSNF